VRAGMAENLLQQLIVLRRARQRAPNLFQSDRLLCGFWSLFLSPGRIRKVAIAFRASTILHAAERRKKGNRHRDHCGRSSSTSSMAPICTAFSEGTP
jgi:hypothetical protein